MSEEKAHTEEFKVDGERLVGKIKDLIHQGNIRRIIIKDKEGKTLFELPMTLGVVGALIAPQLAALGAIAALELIAQFSSPFTSARQSTPSPSDFSSRTCRLNATKR